MRTLYELCINSIVRDDISCNELPSEFQEHIEHYKRYPIRLSYPERFDAASLIQFAQSIKFDICENDLFYIRKGRIREWLLQKKGAEKYEYNWYYLIKKHTADFNNLIRKERIKLFKEYIQFIHANSGLLNIFIQLGYFKFIQTCQNKIKTILAIENFEYFDEEDYKRYQELWGENLKIVHKKEVWKGVHNDLYKKSFNKLVSQEFPNFELDTLFGNIPTELYDILNNEYWQKVLKRVKKRNYYKWWECNEVSDSKYNITEWFYKSKLIYETGYSIYYGNYTIDHTTNTLKISRDKFDTIIVE